MMTPIRLHGDEPFARPPALIVAKLSDAAFLAGSLKEVRVTEATADRAVLSVPPGVSMLPGHLTVELAVVSRGPERTTFLITNKATGASATANAELTFAPTADGGTAVRWVAELTHVTGLLRMVPNSLLRGGMERAIPEVWERLHQVFAAEGS